MEEITWAASKLPMPCVLHDKNIILYGNPAFMGFLTEQDDLTTLDFNQWLIKAIKSQKDAQLFINTMNNQQEIALETEGRVKGALFHWKVYSTPISPLISSQACQMTWLQDSSSSYLNKSYWDLHLRVSKATMQLMKEINDRKTAEEKADVLNKELLKAQENLITASHQAGMAEVTISVLHNIGNVLNSVGVSVEMMEEHMSSLMFKKIALLIDMLKAHESNLLDFFQHDEQGKLLPAYLSVLFEEIQSHQATVKGELDRLRQQYNHIKDILSAQNEVTNRQPITEKVILSHLVDSSIRLVMTEDSMLINQITLNKDYRYTSVITTDRTQLMQLITNLLKNAKESLMELNSGSLKTITIVIDKQENGEFVTLRVMDSGIGILPENLSKLFSFGFTTKKKGHGFGLHNSALIAKQLGGTLQVESEGEGKGAEFILTLPVDNSTTPED
ncbi:sensor histidine kinase [Legionella erythra]|uniref:histidine kinase n=1 Tax=Legionella erythra TaxID=448 RepID=A0A0W0TUB6_LEGER|nr:sensor histidine kinase [Legionella erythra]KTC99116.1 Two-component sensor histidine kinase [Legionella erythra]